MSDGFSKQCEVLDLITKEVILADSQASMAKKINVNRSNVSGLVSGNLKQLKSRFVRPDFHEHFTLVCYDNNEEFICVTPKTLFLHLGIPYSKKDSYPINNLLAIKGTTSFYGRIFYLKGFRPEHTHAKANNQPSKERSKRRIAKRSRLRKSLHRNNIYALMVKITKNKELSEDNNPLLGCSHAFFKKYIESRFEPGMEWDNYGIFWKNDCRSWQIDHIVPCSTFDLTCPEQQKVCFHHENLRPCWEDLNRARPKNGSDITPP